MTGHLRHAGRRVLKAVGGGLALLAIPYAAYVTATWYRYGQKPTPVPGARRKNRLIERFMPRFEVAEQHEIRVNAPAEYTFAAARAMDLDRSAVVRAVFAVRTLPSRLRGEPSRKPAPLLDETVALGWRVLAEIPEREVVVGSVTQPWLAEVKFRGIDPDAFLDFAEPDYAKIVWTLEVEPLGPAKSRFLTETRVCTTDPRARRLFRRYWAVFSPGILLIRRVSIQLVKAEAERRFRAARELTDAVAGT